jgi:hypothetical protein
MTFRRSVRPGYRSDQDGQKLSTCDRVFSYGMWRTEIRGDSIEKNYVNPNGARETPKLRVTVSSRLGQSPRSEP